jgi:D-alanine-D-alanine ligase
MENPQRIKLGILFGGRSGEHEVSINSAASVIAALSPDEYEITAIGITKAGRLASTSEIRRMLPAEVQDRIEPYDSLEASETQMRLTACSRSGPGNHTCPPEIVFPLLHGPYGEDGTIQGLMEIAGLPYVGCGVLASAVGMDKDMMKRLFVQAGLPVPPFRVFHVRSLKARLEEIRRGVERDFGYPLFSKPANLGSSVGVRKIHGPGEFAEAALYSAQFDRKIVIEKGIDARELECAILGNDEPKASVVGEVIPAHEFYDYDAKYVNPASRLEIPARIPTARSDEVQSIALAAFHAIDGSGLARVDFFMDRVTGKIWLNEINTMPGFTPISMYAKLWAATGVPFQELVRRLVQLGMERFRERNAIRISPDS